MNPMHQAKDPAAGVAQQLLPHMHLISKYRYPITNNPSLETIVGYLLEAPKIVRDLQPMQWQFIDPPADGSVLLVWQPLDYLGVNMASDGYVWGDAEQVAKSDVRGYTLEMYLHRSGYRAQGEQMASHCRKRYRLMPSNPGLPPPDPSLFIVHYSRATGRDTVPAASIQVMPQVAQQVQQRRMIQSQGPLARKDFMLHDRSNWPQIHAPPGLARAQPGHRRGPSLGQGEATLEEEEDVSRGDILDFMTPRDISRARYEQHHEWMEEILESPYNIFQIVPGDLGLGRKGELEHLTKDFFDAPLTALRETSGNAEPPRVGRMDKTKADDFKKRATDKIASMQAELEKMRQTHEKRMERLQRATMLNSAEKRLRNTATTTEPRTMSTGSVMDEDDADALDDIAKEVESISGQKIERISSVNLVSRGGLEERTVNRTMSTSSAGRPVMSPMKMQASPSVPQGSMQAAVGQDGMLNQPHGSTTLPGLPQQPTQPSSVSARATPQNRDQDQDQDDNQDDDQDDDQDDQDELRNEPQNEVEYQGPEQNEKQLDDQDQDQDQSMAEEALNAGTATPADDGDLDEDNGELTGLDDMGMDVDMDGLDEQQPDEPLSTEGNEWVMVDQQSEPKGDDSNAQTGAENTPAVATEAESHPPAQPSHQPVADDPQPAQENIEEAVPQPEGQQLDENDFDVGEDFDDVDVDTAGDALANYGADEDEELNLDNMDDNFGDAFHQDHDHEQNDQEIS